MKLKSDKQPIHEAIKRTIASAEHQVEFWREVLLNCEPQFVETASSSLKEAWAHFDDANKQERDFLTDDGNFETVK